MDFGRFQWLLGGFSGFWMVSVASGRFQWLLGGFNGFWEVTMASGRFNSLLGVFKTSQRFQRLDLVHIGSQSQILKSDFSPECHFLFLRA